MYLLKIIFLFKNKVRKFFFPSLREIEVNKYLKDGGDEKFRLEFHLNADSLVLDLGGYKGQWASDIFAKYLCKIIIFEPVVNYYNNIVHRFTNNDNIKVFCLALDNQKRIEQIGISDDGSSFFVKSQQTEEIEFEDVAFFFETHKILEVDLIKINIEGGEYSLLLRLIETGLIKNIKQIHVQFHDFVPNAKNNMNFIKEKLSLTHSNTLEYEFVWENWIRK